MLTNYQKGVIDDLELFLSHLNLKKTVSESFVEYYIENINLFNANKDKSNEYKKPYFTNIESIGDYISSNSQLLKVPEICYKVPTGGGKTLLGCASLDYIFKHYHNKQNIKNKTVLWIVPSEIIMNQTIENFKKKNNICRQLLERDFGISNIGIYSKEDLIKGQFELDDQISIFVLIIDSLKSENNDNRKIYEPNENLIKFTKYIDEENLLNDCEDTCAMQLLHSLRPLIIMDECHLFSSDLSKNMIVDLNPFFILGLSATPLQQSNVISVVNAQQLKVEEMIKLPINVYNTSTVDETFATAISLQQSLESLCIKLKDENEGAYIRPIVLFQANDHGGVMTPDKIKNKLIKQYSIPEEHIKIKISEKNELKNIDLLSEQCPVRYIITIEALREGWDCPFAYILASFANSKSKIGVEQIIGRVLRQPHRKYYKYEDLNTSHIMSCSKDFNDTVDTVVNALVKNGFTENNYTTVDIHQNSKSKSNSNTSDDSILTSNIKTEFSHIANMNIPQFYIKNSNGEIEKLSEEILLENFDLIKDCDTKIDFTNIAKVVSIYIDDENNEQTDTKEFSQVFESELLTNSEYICFLLDYFSKKYSTLSDEELFLYFKEIVENMTDYEKKYFYHMKYLYLNRIDEKIRLAQKKYKFLEFEKIYNKKGVLLCGIYQDNEDTSNPLNTFKLPQRISFQQRGINGKKQLYELEESVNKLEKSMKQLLDSSEYIKWWHRNPKNKYGFHINGPFKHYPDFIAMTVDNRLLIIETKGDNLESDGMSKARLGEIWEATALSKISQEQIDNKIKPIYNSVHYFMVFDSIQGGRTFSIDDFKEWLHESNN